MITDELFNTFIALAGFLFNLIPSPVPGWLVSSAASVGYILGWCKSYSIFIPWDTLLYMTLGLFSTGFVYFAFHSTAFALRAAHLIG